MVFTAARLSGPGCRCSSNVVDVANIADVTKVVVGNVVESGGVGGDCNIAWCDMGTLYVVVED